MKRYFVLTGCLALLLGLVLAAAAPASAFCVYNKTSVQLQVEQTKGCKFDKGFSKFIDPGEHACCNWKNHDCNKHGHKDSIVTFRVPSPAQSYLYLCEDVRVRADGWMDIEVKDGKIRCTAHH